jgi:hypothetical protein
MNELESKNLLLCFEYMLDGLLKKIEENRRLLTSEGVEMAEFINDASVKLYQARADLERARKL